MLSGEEAKFICTGCSSKCELVCHGYGGNESMSCPWSNSISGWKRISKEEVVIPPEQEEEEKEDESPINVKIVGV